MKRHSKNPPKSSEHFNVYFWIIASIAISAELILIILYLIIFNGGISSNNSDWILGQDIINSFVIALLTLLNILVFYRITILIEHRNENRDIRSKLFEVESYIFQLRKDRYDKIKQHIIDIHFDIKNSAFNEATIDELMKDIVLDNETYLFKSDNFKDVSFLSSVGQTLYDNLKIFKSQRYNLLPEQITDIDNSLIDYLNVMELYIFGQVMRDGSMLNYIEKNRGFIDSTIICANDLFKEMEKKLK